MESKGCGSLRDEGVILLLRIWGFEFNGFQGFRSSETMPETHRFHRIKHS